MKHKFLPVTAVTGPAGTTSAAKESRLCKYSLTIREEIKKHCHSERSEESLFDCCDRDKTQ